MKYNFGKFELSYKDDSANGSIKMDGMSIEMDVDELLGIMKSQEETVKLVVPLIKEALELLKPTPVASKKK